MAYTPKQERNSTTGQTVDSAAPQPPSVVPEIASAIRQAEAVALAYGQEGHDQILSVPAGSGPSPASSPMNPGRVIGDNGSIWKWDSGLAIDERPGEA